ncbi:MAG: MerR family transcriptional regulator [Bacteroidetes bacterium]|nr:MAG: MerR family transcriptional regulator [Bacteroidota bacterium]
MAYKLKDIERMTGLRSGTIRMWEKRYGLLQPVRSETNIRAYDKEEVKKLLLVEALKRCGYRISNLAKCTPQELTALAEKELLAESEEGAVGVWVQRLLSAALDFDELAFQQWLNRAVFHLGHLQTYRRVLVPLLQRAGLLWNVGKAESLHEHFLSNLIRGFFFSAVERLPLPNRSEAPFLVFLPEGEFHEIPLLFAHYGLLAQGRRSVYLGQNFETDLLSHLQRTFRPRAIVTFYLMDRGVESFVNYLDTLRSELPGVELFVGAPERVAGKLDRPPEGVRLFTEPAAILEAFSEQ